MMMALSQQDGSLRDPWFRGLPREGERDEELDSEWFAQGMPKLPSYPPPPASTALGKRARVRKASKL
jgi:hypothetical protein